MKHSDVTQMLYVHLLIFVQKCTVSGRKMTDYELDVQDSIPDKVSLLFFFPSGIIHWLIFPSTICQ